MRAAPSPGPIYVVLDQASSNPDVWTVLTSIAPFVVSLVALGGVIWSSHHAARTTLRAEDKRAAATVEAEDRRAAATLEADDRRHAQALDQEQAQRRASMRHDLYTRIERINKPLGLSCLAFTDTRDAARWNDRRAELGASMVEMRTLRSETSLYASTPVSRCWDDVFYKAMGVAIYADEVLEYGKPESGDKLKEHAKGAWDASKKLSALMREELGVHD